MKPPDQPAATTDDAVRAAGELIDDRYRIVGHLGRGGMGHVYRAEHVRIRRPVALKLLRAEFRNIPGFQARFEREAFASGQLRHPNCVQVTDCGTLDDGSSFLVMELLEGRSLADVLETERHVRVTRALRIARHVLQGLSHAHEAGVVHRDIKPENVFLVKHGDDPTFAKILDFGIAKLVDEAASEVQRNLTEAGTAIGSPRYMSPEQATGGTVDARSDIYSLSVLLYEMLCGRTPFTGDHPIDIVRQHIGAPPPPFAEVDPALNVPPEVEALVMRGLSKSPDDRFASAAEYAAEIGRLLAAPPRSAAPAAPRPSASTSATAAARPRAFVPTPAVAAPAARQRQLWIAGGVGLLVLIVIIAVAASGDSDEQPESAGEVGIADEQEDDEVDMTPIVLDRGVPDEAIDEIPELADVQKLIRSGADNAAHSRLKRLRKKHRHDPHLNYLLGHVYMNKRWWEDGFESYREAIAGYPDYRKDPALIQNAIRNLSSPSQAWRGERFLRREIGEDAIPYLEEAAKGSRSRRIRENAARLLKRLR